MGRNHARVLSGMEDVDLVGVVDLDLARAEAVAEKYEATGYYNLDTLPDVEFAVVAVPTISHRPVAQRLIERGTSVLVEKPLAPTPEDADHLVNLAEKHGVLLASGHVERFNPVASVIANMVRSPHLMQFVRLSPFTPRIRESVVFDLMVHDLDLACVFAGAFPTDICASGSAVLSETLDVAIAVLTFPSGCVASVTGSRITQDKVRHIRVSEAERFFDADCLRQELSIKRETTEEYLDATYQQASIVEIPYLDRRAEPLGLELRNVIDAIRGEGTLQVDGRAGADVVRLAHNVESAIKGK